MSGLEINGVRIEETFAEAFDMKVTRLIVTAADRQWCDEAANAMVGFGASVIACGIEIAVEQELAPEQTPDGRPGVAILAFAVSGSELEKQIPRRAGQCVLTCPTTAIYSGWPLGSFFEKKVPLGKSLRYFGDGNQISKVMSHWDQAGTETKRRLWRIPVMDGEFVCEHDVGRTDAIGGGNFILMGRSMPELTVACRAAIDAMSVLPGMITPFPGGATRSGSKVGSKYPTLFASTNEAYCPTLRDRVKTLIPDDAEVCLEVVIDGLNQHAISHSMRIGIEAACRAPHDNRLIAVTAGNYGGKLGRHHFHLTRLWQKEPQ